MFVLSRWEAIRTAFRIFIFATGTSRIGIVVQNNKMILLGAERLKQFRGE